MGVLTAGTVLLAMVAAAPPAGTATAVESRTLVLRSKAAIASTPSRRALAPYAMPMDEIDLEFPKASDPRLAASPSSCAGERALCYDDRSGRIVYKPARQFMPSLPGFTPESLSLKRDRIVFRYSF